MSADPTTRNLDELLRHELFVRRLARSLLAPHDGVDDIVQDTWLRAMEHPPDARGDVRGWLGTVVRNLVHNWRIGSFRRERREHASATGREGASIRDVLERQELQKRVVDALARLPDEQAGAIVLRFFDGLPPREIAERLGVSVETVKKRLTRGRAQLREDLDGSFDGGRAGWLAALPALVAPRAAALVSVTAKAGGVAGAAGAIVMGVKSKAAFAAGGLLCFAGVLWIASRPTATPVGAPGPTSAGTTTAVAASAAPDAETMTRPATAMATVPFRGDPDSVLVVTDALSGLAVGGAMVAAPGRPWELATDKAGRTELGTLAQRPSLAITLALVSGEETVGVDRATAPPSPNHELTARVPFNAQIKLTLRAPQQVTGPVTLHVLDFPVPPTNLNLASRELEALEFNRIDPELYLTELQRLGGRPHPLDQLASAQLVEGDGRTDIFVPFRGRAVVQAEGNGLVLATALVELTPGTVSVASLELSQTPFVSGVVVDSAGKPMAGAVVMVDCHTEMAEGEFLPRGNRSSAGFGAWRDRLTGDVCGMVGLHAKSGADGVWSCAVPFTRHVVACAFLPGHERAVEFRHVKVMETITGIKLTVTPAQAADTFTVVDADSQQPLAGLTFTVHQRSPIDPFQIQYPKMTTDEHGRVSCGWLDPAVRYSMHWIKSGDGAVYEGPVSIRRSAGQIIALTKKT